MSTSVLEAPSPRRVSPEPELPALSQKPPRLLFLEGLRGVALLLVLVFHAWLYGAGAPLLVSLPGGSLDVTAPAYLGFTGVRLFVVLSGFCLTYSLAYRDLRVPVWRFWWRRAWRILPPYYVALALFVLAGMLTDHRPTVGDVLTHVLMIHNLFPQWLLSINGAWWTLALEVQFYLLFPMLIACFRRWGVRRSLLAALVLSLAWRTWAWHAHDLSTQVSAYFWCYALPGRLFEFVLGMAAAVAVARRRELLAVRWQRRYLLGIGGFAALGVLVVSGWSRFAPVADILWGLTFFSLVMYAATCHAVRSPVCAGRALTGMGRISYSVYLLHVPMMAQVAKLFPVLGLPPLVAWLVFGLVTVPLSLAVGWLFYRLVECRFVGSCPDLKRLAASFRKSERLSSGECESGDGLSPVRAQS
jgi:peptidoglycan/LPS O-acetylase OafA/YrhL